MSRMGLVLVLLAGVGGCSKKSAGAAGACEGNADCEAGNVCIDHTCVGVCGSDAHCGGNLICVDGVCREGERQSPRITGLAADGSADADPTHADNHLRRQVTLFGENFEGAQVTLSDLSGSRILDKCSETPTALVVALPDGLGAGSYNITVSNQAGDCSAALPILQGEQGSQGPQGAPGVPCTDCVGTAELESNAVGLTEVKADEIQARVTGTCAAGRALSAVQSDGQVTCNGPFAGVWTEQYSETFSNPPLPAQWDYTTRHTCNPANETILGGSGNFSSGTITLSLSGLPSHTELRLVFDAWLIDSWDMNQGEAAGLDGFRVDLDGASIYADSHGYSLGDANLCGTNTYVDLVKRVDLQAFHTAATASLRFVAKTNEGPTNESFGIDNVRVLLR